MLNKVNTNENEILKFSMNNESLNIDEKIKELNGEENTNFVEFNLEIIK